jgi:hypothetical protein
MVARQDFGSGPKGDSGSPFRIHEKLM